MSARNNKQLIEELTSDGYLKTAEIANAFRAIDRADFVLPGYRNEAYGNYPLPILAGQTISQPLTVAFMLELLEPKAGDIVLDIGAGSGWQTALLAHIVRAQSANGKGQSVGKIIAVERIPELCEFAKNNIEKYGFIRDGVVEFHCQDATAAIPDGPYDKIIAAAAALKDIPDEWRQKLKIGGKIVAPIAGSIWRFTKRQETGDKRQEIIWEEEEFPGFAFVPLVTDNVQPRQRRGSPRAATTDNPSSVTDNLRLITYNWPRALISCVSLLVVSFSLFVYEIALPHTDFDGSKNAVIETGMGSRKIGLLLKQEGFIDSKWAFVLYVSLAGIASDLKPGTYEWHDAVTIIELARDLKRGGTNERSITIPEGWTAREIAEYVGAENPALRANMLRVTGNPAERFKGEFPFLLKTPPEAGLEGYLFPDTYRVFRDALAEDIIRKMLTNFDQKLTPELREEIRRQNKTVFDIVRTASLIEKEVVSDEDRALVSGILWKRLRLGIPLQVDATVLYAKQSTINNQQPTTRISAEDTKIDSPYNTYKYYGLPPGPIANPGISAIRAAIYPQESEFLYYLSAPDGRTIFSRTLDEHNAAIRKYLTK